VKKFSINKTSYPAIYSSCKNFGEVLSWVEHEGAKDKLFITKLVLNDRVIDSDEENLLDRLAVAEIHQLDITLQVIEELVVETLCSTIELIQNLQTRSIDQAKYIAKNNEFHPQSLKEVFGLSRTLIDTLEEVFSSHNKQKVLLKHFSLWREAEKELSTIMQCILQSFEMDSPAALGELLQSPFPDALDSWEEVLVKELNENRRLVPFFQLKSHSIGGDNTSDAKTSYE